MYKYILNIFLIEFNKRVHLAKSFKILWSWKVSLAKCINRVTLSLRTNFSASEWSKGPESDNVPGRTVSLSLSG